MRSHLRTVVLESVPQQPDILTAGEFFDLASCADLIREMKTSPDHSALTYGRQNRGVIDQNVRRVSQRSVSIATASEVKRRLSGVRQRLQRHFKVELHSFEEPQFLCYRAGDFFVAHQDGNTGLIQLASDAFRKISVSIFLNNQSSHGQVDSYGGGSLVLSDWRTSATLEVNGQAGTLIAFRSETTHEVTPITFGERYAIVTWFGRD